MGKRTPEETVPLLAESFQDEVEILVMEKRLLCGELFTRLGR